MRDPLDLYTSTDRFYTQRGITLVEICIAVLFIGLIIFGVLQVKELIFNARLNGTMQQVQSYEAAIDAFKKYYGVYPGDITDPANRLPACGAAGSCSTPGDGSGIISALAITRTVFIGYGINDEGRTMWTHLSTAGFIGNEINRSSVSTVRSFGDQFPSTPVAGGLHYVELQIVGAPNIAGQYFYIRNGAGAGFANGIQPEGNDNSPFTPLIAARIDQKFDDGFPDSGNVIGIGTGCEGIAGANSYTFARADNRDCGLFIGKSSL